MHTVAELHTQLGDTAEAIAIYRGLLHDQNRRIQLMAHAGLGRLLGPAEALVHLQHAAELTVERRRSLPMEELQARYSSESSIHHTRLEATAADLRAEPAPRLLHIAAHGYTNANAPVCSTLELADGPFLLLEAHRLNLRGTQLVTLSACETSVRPDYGDMALVLAGALRKSPTLPP